MQTPGQNERSKMAGALLRLTKFTLTICNFGSRPTIWETATTSEHWTSSTAPIAGLHYHVIRHDTLLDTLRCCGKLTKKGATVCYVLLLNHSLNRRTADDCVLSSAPHLWFFILLMPSDFYAFPSFSLIHLLFIIWFFPLTPCQIIMFPLFLLWSQLVYLK